MAISSTSSGTQDSFNSEINITPFVDVVLVLLLIFVAGSAISFSAIKLDLPTSESKTQVSLNTQTYKLHVISITKAGAFYINQERVRQQDLKQRIQKIYSEKNIQHDFAISGDKQVNYDKVLYAIDTLKSLNIESISLVTD